MESYVSADILTMKNFLNPTDPIASDGGFLISFTELSDRRDVEPSKFDGMAFFLCLDGRFVITIDGAELTIGPSSITAASPDSEVTSLRPADEGAGATVLIIAISKKCFFDLKLDVAELLGNIRFDGIVPNRPSPFMELPPDVCRILADHGRLILKIDGSSLDHKKDYIALQLTSIIYILNRAAKERLRAQSARRRAVMPPARSRSAFTEFIGLAVNNFERERGIKFYADRMCLTPKYLSKLIKEECGNSASSIIDGLVLSKARNLLKHSDLSVKVIAARLNFSTQSAFNKFFKAKTGMPPLKYRGT